MKCDYVIILTETLKINNYLWDTRGTFRGKLCKYVCNLLGGT